MALRVVAFANSNIASDAPASPSLSGPTLPKSTGGPHLSIDFSRCTPTVIHHSLSDLCNHLRALLSACHGTKDVKVKEMNQDTKNDQRIFLFLSSGVEKSKARIYEEDWLKAKFP